MLDCLIYYMHNFDIYYMTDFDYRLLSFIDFNLYIIILCFI